MSTPNVIQPRNRPDSSESDSAQLTECRHHSFICKARTDVTHDSSGAAASTRGHERTEA